MNIGILEYQDYHKVYTHTLEEISSNHNVYIYFNIKDALGSTDKLDLLFVNTIRPLPWDMYKWFRFKPKCKTILTTHEINTDFKTMRFIIKKFDAISVPLKTMKEQIEKKFNGKIFTLPFMLHEKVYPNTNNMIVVPGKIEDFRRDYSIIFKNMLKSEHWCFLGEPIGIYGHKVMLECINRNDYGYNIKYFSSFVPKKLYEDILKGSKIIYAPLKNPTKGHNGLFKEYYGKTKACGAMFEAIKYGKTFKSNLDIKVDYKDYLVKDWIKYFEKEIIEGFVNE